MDDVELTRKAIEEIVHQSQFESHDFPKERKTNPLGKLNKNFLGRTLNHVIRHNERESKRIRRKCRKKLKELDRRKDRHGSRKHKKSTKSDGKKRKHKHSHREKRHHHKSRESSHEQIEEIDDNVEDYHDLNTYAYAVETAEEQYCRNVVLCYQALLKSTEDTICSTQVATNPTASIQTINLSSDEESVSEDIFLEKEDNDNSIEVVDSDDELVLSSNETTSLPTETAPTCIDLDSDESSSDVIILTD